MPSHDTIVAIATPLGEGGLGVVRLSGPLAIDIAERLFHSTTALSQALSHTLHYGWIYNDSRVVDEAVVSVYRAPRSYTGDDSIEFSCHGSMAVLKEVVSLCCEKGARPARPGEFTERAFLNGKLDLAQAEAVAELIRSRSSKAAAAALGQLQGKLSERVSMLRQKTIDALAKLEANLDFSDEEVPAVSRDQIKNDMQSLRDEVDRLLSTSVRGRVLREGVRVALAGRPNVGKSSLFNALLAQNRAIVTDVPGTTRDTLEEKFEWAGHSVVLTDTAGLRTTSDAVEREGTERAREAQRAADVVLAIIDQSETISDDDRAVIAGIDPAKRIVVLNKCDRSSKLSEADLKRWKEEKTVRTSAVTGEGLDELKAHVIGRFISDGSESEDATVITNLRHAHLLQQTKESLSKAVDGFANGASEESIAIDLRAAVDQLGGITGESATEQILSSIFRQFCIGK